MLGSDLVAELVNRGHEVVAPGLDELDITNPVSVAEIPQLAEGCKWCINCAAYTAVDKAETERDEACQVNAIAPGYLATACAIAGARLIHISTDFVFDGTASTPYTEEAPTSPLGYYGLTKRDGEDAVRDTGPGAIIVRTSWLFGPNGGSFPRTMIRAWEAGKELRVVSDQTGCPTYTVDLARTLVDIAGADLQGGTYHAAGPESMTWHEFAVRVLKHWEARKPKPREVVIAPIPTSAYPTPAKRPAYSVLSTAKLTGAGVKPMRPVDEAIVEFISRGLRLPAWP